MGHGSGPRVLRRESQGWSQKFNECATKSPALGLVCEPLHLTIKPQA
jgi:hypothetical protein